MYVKVRDNTSELWVGFGPGELRLVAGYKKKNPRRWQFWLPGNKSTPHPGKHNMLHKNHSAPYS